MHGVCHAYGGSQRGHALVADRGPEGLDWSSPRTDLSLFAPCHALLGAVCACVLPVPIVATPLVPHAGSESDPGLPCTVDLVHHDDPSTHV